MATTAQELTNKNVEGWQGFNVGIWQSEINVRDFIQQNYTPYEGDASFLANATVRTTKIWARLNELFVEERKKAFSMFRRSQVALLHMAQVISISQMN